MILSNIGLIAADTSRSRAYLQALVRNDLFPNSVVLLEYTSTSILPGQLKKTDLEQYGLKPGFSEECWSEVGFDPTLPIKEELERHHIPYEIATNKDINDPIVVQMIKQRPESVFIYSGFGGVLLRKDVLNAGKKYLHVHGGYLPNYKGSTTNYYSLIVEGTMGASAIFLSEEIDSGPVLLRREFPCPPDKLAIDHCYDSAARAKVLVETLNKHIKSGSWEFELPNNIGGETYFIIHPVLKHIAILGAK